MLSPDASPVLAALPTTWQLGWLAAGAIAGGAVSLGMLRVTRRNDVGSAGLLPTTSPARPQPVRPTPQIGATRLHRATASLYRWLNEHPRFEDLWPAFDQIVREVLAEHFDATRIRCYQIRAGDDRARPLNKVGTDEPATGPDIREGVFGHVVTTAREYVSTDPGKGPLVHDLASADDSPWDWVWPIVDHTGVIGIVALGNVKDPDALASPDRAGIGQVIASCWRHITCCEQLHVLRCTDRATGVLTRSEFFTLAGNALADSYREREPVVVAVLALEGLRHMDDTGRWRDRDALIQRIGPAITRRVRSDDLVGRFADDRFVILLRRLDSGLGRLIAEKILATARDDIAKVTNEATPVHMRIGLAGSGLTQPGLEDLLVHAFEAVEHARKTDVTLVTDLQLGHQPGAQPS